MELVGLSDIDLNGALFIHFPDEVPLDECRERLELLVYETYEEDCEGLADDERPQMCLSPYWIYRALSRKRQNELNKMTKAQRDAELKWCIEDREKRKTEYPMKQGLTTQN